MFSGYQLCINVILLYYPLAIGERTKLPRYAFNSELKPAIVGSYSYDMVKGKFILPETNTSTTEISLTDIILSTPSNNSLAQDLYRKHVGMDLKTKSFNWWTRSRLMTKNSTKHHTTFFKGSKVSNHTSAKPPVIKNLIAAKSPAKKMD